MNLTKEEQIFLLAILNNRVTHPNQIGWVNPMNKEMVFTHQEMVNLHRKIAETQVAV